MPRTINSYIKKYFEKIKNHYLFPHLIFAMLLIIFFILMLSIILKIYTFHDREIILPDFRGSHIDKVNEKIEKLKLRSYVFDSTYVKNTEPGIIVDQHPKPGSKVKKRRKIYFTINAHKPQKVIMPDVVQLPLKQAIAILQRNGLEIGRVIYEPDISINMVLDQRVGGRRISPGESIYKGTNIDLVVGMGLSGEKGNIPNLIGLTLDEAKLIAAENYFTIGAIIYDNKCLEINKNKAIIYKQKPEHNNDSNLPLGSGIDVWLTCDSTIIKNFNENE